MTKLLEQILDDENMELAKHRVYANKGAGGVDGVTIEELSSYMGVSAVNFSELAAITDKLGFLLYYNLDFYHT